MDELLRNLGIEQTEDVETIVKELELKQSEIMERLDNVEDEKRRKKLEDDLNQIAGAISAVSWMRGKAQTGIAREKDTVLDVPDDFSDLKNQPEEEKQEQVAVEKQETKNNNAKSKEELYDQAYAALATQGADMMQKLAEDGYARAQWQLGELYRDGNHAFRVAKDESAAVEWYRKAAEQNYAPAQRMLGSLYEQLGDYEEAARWYEKAASRGDTELQNKVQRMKELAEAAETQKRREREKKYKAEKRVKRIKIAAPIIIILMIGNFFYYEVAGAVYGLIPFIPDISYTGKVHIYDTPVPYFISLVPLKELSVQSNANNLSVIINPFGAKKMTIDHPMRKVKIHNGTEEVALNCEKLEKLSIPDSVTTLVLWNVTDELALSLKLSANLEKLTIKNSPSLTDAGLQAIEIPETVQYFTISYCDNFNNVESINLPQEMRALSIYDCDGIRNVNITNDLEALHVDVNAHDDNSYTESVTLSGTIDYVYIEGEIPALKVDCTSKGVYISSYVSTHLIVEGAVDKLYVGSHVNDIEYITKPIESIKVEVSGVLDEDWSNYYELMEEAEQHKN